MRDGRSPSHRQLRVGEELRHSLAEVLLRGELRDPDLADASITVTEVRISPDLRNATAFIMPLGGANMERILPALRRAAPFLRTRVGKGLRLRFTPTLSFQADTSFDYAQNIDRLLRKGDRTDSAATEPTDDTDDDIGDGQRAESGDGSQTPR